MKVCREPDYLSVMHEMNLSRSGTVVIFDNDNHTAARLRKYYDPEDLMFGDDIYLEDLYSSDEAVIKFSLGDTMLWYDSSYDNLLSRHLTFDVSYMLGYYVEVCGLSDYEAKLKILKYLSYNKHNPSSDRLFNFIFWYENVLSVDLDHWEEDPIDEMGNISSNIRADSNGYVDEYYRYMVTEWLGFPIEDEV